jgi:hypothetical protein
LKYHSELNKIFLFKYYWYDTIDRGIRVDRHHGLVEINIEAILRNVDDVFFFLPSNGHKFIIHKLLHLERIVL